MKLDTNYLNKLTYTEINLKDISLQIVPAEDDGGDDTPRNSGVCIDEGSLTEHALKQLCEILRIPYPFTQVLRSNGKIHVILYMQKQLSQLMAHSSVVAVGDGDGSIISMARPECLLYGGRDAIELDRRIKDTLEGHPVLELKDTLWHGGDICYSIYYKEGREMKADHDGMWKWGYSLRHSAVGDTKPLAGTEVMSEATMAVAYLPQKTYSHAIEDGEDFESRWSHVKEFLDTPPTTGWTDLDIMLTHMKATASYREVSEARNKLLKLKADKFDTDTDDRISQALEWDRIVAAYDVKAMNERPPRSWFARAGTPVKLQDVYEAVSREATHAPNSIDETLRQNLLWYAGAILAGKPDIHNLPPKIDWSVN